MGKYKDKNIKKKKNAQLEVVPIETENEPLPDTRRSDDPPPKKVISDFLHKFNQI